MHVEHRRTAPHSTARDAMRRTASSAPADVVLDLTLTRERCAPVLLGFFLAVAVQYGSLAYLNKFQKRFVASLDAKSRADLGVRCASSVWGLVCGLWAARLIPMALERSTDAASRIYASPPLESCETLVRLAVGYFMWDALVSYKYYDAQYFWHAVVSCFVFGVPQFMPRGFLHLYAAVFLLWEITLPFLSARYILIKAGMGSTKLFQVINFTGFALWIFVRFVVGLPLMYLYFTDAYAMFATGRASPKWVYMWYVTAAVILQIMNLIWLSAIVRALFPKKRDKKDVDGKNE